MSVKIRSMKISEMKQTLELVREVFMEFEAPEYSEEGVREFLDFVADDNITEMLRKGEFKIYVAVMDRRIVGMICVKPSGHISLLFVNKKYHRQGIARALFNTAFDGYGSVITVNSSPYAVEAYRHLGFMATDKEQILNGIRFIPMHYKFS